MTENRLIEIFRECWASCSVESKVDVSNIYARENESDSEIFYNDDDFFSTFYENDPNGAVRAVFFGKFRYIDPYVWFNGYGNLETGEFADEISFCDVDMMAKWYLENYDEISHIEEMSEFCDACEGSLDEDEEEEED